jgi:nucleotide-binding universal stress UspA family protein
MIKTILVPIDGSEHAQKAVELAGDIAGKYDAKVKLLYVRPEGPLPESLRHLAAVEYGLQSRPETPPGQPTTVLRPSSGGDAEISRKLGEKLIERAVRDAREHGARDVTGEVEDGDPAERILRHAETDKVNLIVMGSRGIGSLRGLLMGSVSQKVSQLAPCSCITVR